MPLLDRPALLDRLAGIGLLSLDVDGVQTDGGLYYAEDGSELRRFHVHDGQGIKQVMAAGVAVAFVTASTTPAIGHRAARLGVAHAFLGVPDKEAALAGLCQTLGLGLDRVAHVGDDVNDLGLLRLVGCPLTVANARPEVRDACLYVTTTPGGAGAVREICDLILNARTETTRRDVR
ncbi:KdsC family phosphatase [Marinibaculum pumilum]|uniref:KdsC family phosphatase n=1 Tax=Marinibaculum pumilum TaxID=1766165 RepID=A0ABV7KXE0_9PROT